MVADYIRGIILAYHNAFIDLWDGLGDTMQAIIARYGWRWMACMTLLSILTAVVCVNDAVFIVPAWIAFFIVTTWMALSDG